MATILGMWQDIREQKRRKNVLDLVLSNKPVVDVLVSNLTVSILFSYNAPRLHAITLLIKDGFKMDLVF